MPRKPRSRPAEDADDLGFLDYLNNSPEPLPHTPCPRVSVEVTDDWPDQVPIGRREIEVTETHLETVLAELLGPLP